MRRDDSTGRRQPGKHTVLFQLTEPQIPRTPMYIAQPMYTHPNLKIYTQLTRCTNLHSSLLTNTTNSDAHLKI